MPKAPQEPGPGRSTSEAAFNELRKEIAQRNEKAQQAARKLRAARDREQAQRRRRHDAS
jgi:hypothetical protein